MYHMDYKPLTQWDAHPSGTTMMCRCVPFLSPQQLEFFVLPTWVSNDPAAPAVPFDFAHGWLSLQYVSPPEVFPQQIPSVKSGGLNFMGNDLFRWRIWRASCGRLVSRQPKLAVRIWNCLLSYQTRTIGVTLDGGCPELDDEEIWRKAL